jgi:hypothetical protein
MPQRFHTDLDWLRRPCPNDFLTNLQLEVSQLASSSFVVYTAVDTEKVINISKKLQVALRQKAE